MTIIAKKIMLQLIVLAAIMFVVPTFGTAIFQDERVLLWLYLPIAFFVLIPVLVIYLLRIRKGNIIGLNNFLKVLIYFSIIYLILLFLLDLGSRLFLLLYVPSPSGQITWSGLMLAFKSYCSFDYLLDKEYGFWYDFGSMTIYLVEIVLSFIAIKINKSLIVPKGEHNPTHSLISQKI